jgi:hypothetical protein
MSTRNKILGLIFLVAVLAFGLFVAKRLLFQTGPKRGGVTVSPPRAGSPVTTPALPKPSAAVPVPSSLAPSSNGQAQEPTPAARGAAAGAAKAPSAVPKGTATATEDRTRQLQFEAGVRLWIRVTLINRKPDGSFTFRGTLLQPVALANTNQLDQDSEVSGSGTVNNGHVTVLLSGFTVGGANYALRQDEANGSNRHPGTGLAVELDPGKLLEVWLASSSVYRKTP